MPVKAQAAIRVFVSACLLALAAAPLAAQQPASALTLENLWTLRSVSAPKWSPDGSRLAYVVSDPKTLGSVIVVATVDGKQTRLIQSAERTGNAGDDAGRAPAASLIEKPWTPDGRELLYTSRGEIRAVDVERNAHRTLVAMAGASPGYVPQVYFNGPDPVLSPDGRRLAWVQESEIWTLDLQRGAVRKVTSARGQGWHQMAPTWSPDSQRVLFTSQAIDEQRPFPFTDFSGMVIKVSHGLIGYGRVRLGVVSSDGGAPSWIGPEEGTRYSLRGGSQAHWSPDSRTILINRISLDHTEREVLLASGDGGTPRRVWHEKVDRWVSPLAIWTRWAPDSRRFLLTSERDGWNHIYVVDTMTGAETQVTRGAFTVTSNQVYDGSEVTPDWSADGTTIYFPSNEASTAERHLYAVAADGGVPRRLTPRAGVNQSSAVSPNGSHLAYLWSDAVTLPEIYVQPLSGGKPSRLTNEATPAALTAHQWIRPRIVQFPSRADGAAVAARLYEPRELDKSRRYPAVVFIHGGGYVQSVFNGWAGGLDRHAFNQYLAEQGYVVLDVDYRGSAGYGAQFRLDVFDRLGEIDVEDVLGGVDHLRGLGYVDINRLGIWGHSYGGFLTAASMLRAPDVFAAGVAGAPVTDWERFFYLAPGYNEEHFGFPWDNPEGTKKASPLTHAASLESPMLILSGMQDTMHLDSVVLVNEFLKTKRPVDWLFYPSEAHGFRDPRAREDYFRRTAEYLNLHLGVSASNSDPKGNQ